MKKILRLLFSKKETRNASWIIGCRIAEMLLSFILGIWTARYLGPSNYGIINYVASYVTFFTSFCTLGLNAIIVKELIDHPDEQGKTLGTAIVMRSVSSLLSIAAIVGIICIVDRNETVTIMVAACSSIALFFQVFDIFQYWFQSRYESKISSIAALLGYVVVSGYKIYLLISGAPVYLFALSTSIDCIVVAIFLFIVYKKYGGAKLRFDFAKGKKLLQLGYHFILSGLMVSIYGQTDKIMLKHMLSEEAVGHYGTATALCKVWVFVLAAIIDSIVPTIMSLHKNGDREAYLKKNRQLYCIIFYVSVFVSLFFTLFGGLAVDILYGQAYHGAILPLKIITWYTAFSYIGVARNAWIVCEGKQKYVKYMYLGAIFVNIGLNYLLIPVMQASGAALASLITQIMTSIILPLLWKEMRPNVRLIFEAVTFKNVFPEKRSKN